MADRQSWARSGARPRLRFSTDDRLIGLVRGGDPSAFEVLYDRHSRELLSFCRHMLGSRQDAEDAVQATFASAYKALIADERAIVLRPWLFAIARNACLSVLRQRRPHGEGDRDVASHEDPIVRVEQREDLRTMLANVRELPERQRTALVLAELHGLSHEEIGALLGVRASQVKSYVYQARSTLISERQARGVACREIREELSAARGAALLKGRLRRHLRSCADCSDYARRLSQQRRQLGALLPLGPALALKRRVLEAALGKGSGGAAETSLAAPSAELAGGGLKVIVVKALVATACVGATAGVGVGARLSGGSVSISHRGAPPLDLDSSSRATGIAHVVASVSPLPTRSPGRAAARAAVVIAARPGPSAPDTHGAPGGTGVLVATATAPVAEHAGRESHAGGQRARKGKSDRKALGGSEAAHGKAGESHGGSETGHKGDGTHGKSEEAHGKSEAAAGGGERKEADGNGEGAHGKSTEARNSEPSAASGGEGEEPHGKAEEAHGKAK